MFSTYYGLFFFKQKTAYEMRMSDWSSDVCSDERRKPNESGRTSIVPDPMISSPSSASSFRIENIRSCLRSVDAPSTPSSSAISTSSAGDLVLRSLRCLDGFQDRFWEKLQSFS